MKTLYKGMLFCCLILLGGCVTEQPDQPVGDSTAESGAAQTGDQAINVASPDADSGFNQSVQGQAGAAAAKTIAPLTQ
jgi:hypothetical protein